jgi:phenylalanyl-tRNA synthetase beta chain
VARDLAARLRVPFRLPEPDLAESGPAAAELASVEIEAPELCGRLVARVLQDVRVQPSPAWMAARLALAGMRPINNVVDASNYVMLELGQPNHPYDLALLNGRGLRVRRARAGDSMVTLDDVERPLTPDDLLICDATDAPVGIAGVMGGAGSEIRPATTEVLLEAAWFDPMAIARTSKRLGLRTEASSRFERGCDPEIIPLAAARFCELVAATGASVATGAVDAVGRLPGRETVRVRTSRVNRVLGSELTDADIRSYLEPIGFAASPRREGELDVVVPSWRPDSSTEIDVIEEVARHHGYSKIVPTMPSSARAGALTARQRDRRLVRQVLAGAGASEAWTTTFLAPADLTRAGLPADALRLANPLVAEESLLRTSLLPGLLKALSHNAAHRNHGVALFEIGHVFLPPPDGARLPDEREMVAVAMDGCDATEAVDVWRVLAEGIGLHECSLAAATSPGLHATRTADVHAGGRRVGVAGEVDPGVVEAFGLEGRVAWFEVDLGLLLDAPHGDAVYRPVSRFPSSDIDLAFIVDEATPAGTVAGSIRDAAGDLLVGLELFDVYRGDPVPEGRRSLAYRLRLQARDRTLTDEEVAELRRRCIERVERDHGASLRG